MNRSDLHPDIQKALAELDKNITETDADLQNVSGKTADEIMGLRIFRNMCSLYGALLLGSDMTEEEKELLRQEHLKDEKLYIEAINGDGSMRGKVITHYAADWCNAHHFDYRGLIEKGLALEAEEDMYK